MLSLIGSIQPDPFSPLHVAQPAILSTQPRSQKPASIVLEEEEEEDEVSAFLTQEQDDLNADLDSDSPFALLGQRTDELRLEVAQKAKEAEAAEKEAARAAKAERKRKRREARAEGVEPPRKVKKK